MEIETKKNRYEKYIMACLKDIEGHLSIGDYYEARKTLSDAHGYAFLLEEEQHFNPSR